MWLWLACASPSVPPGDTDGRVCDLVDALPSCALTDACHASFPDLEAFHELDCAEPLSWPDACGGFPDATLDQAQLVFVGSFPELYTSAPQFTVTDAASWTDLQALAHGDTSSWDTVDFATEIVVIARLQVSSTCGFGPSRHGLVGTGADYAPRLYVEWEDSSGACDEVCDMELDAAVAYRVARARPWPEVCSRVVNRCG